MIPAASPGPPLVRAKIRSCDAACTPVFHVFSPLITQSSPSRTAAVSMCVASEPCAGSVMPKANPVSPAASGSVHSPALLGRAVFEHQQQADVVADDHVLVLQVAVQPEPLRRRGARG